MDILSWMVAVGAILSCTVFALYNFLSIKGRTMTHIWHFVQYAHVVLFVAQGALIGRWVQSQAWEWFWHDFGNLAALLLPPAILSYIITLRLLQRRER